jgi:hypothetical protein
LSREAGIMPDEVIVYHSFSSSLIFSISSLLEQVTTVSSVRAHTTNKLQECSLPDSTCE